MAGHQEKIKNGFTLIEMLVAMAIFVVVLLTVTDIFLIGLGSTERIFGSQAVQENGRFILESVSKEVRMSKINSLGGGPLSSLNIINANGQVVTYSFDSVNKRITRNGASLSSNDTETTGAFYLTNDGGIQPRLTMTLTLINKTSRASSQAAINLQMTVSSRRYAQ